MNSIVRSPAQIASIHDAPTVPTPTIEIPVRLGDVVKTVMIKMEGEGPLGSVKSRTARSLLLSMEQDGQLGPGGSVVESTSGNLGVAPAALCHLRGYAFRAVVDPKVPRSSLDEMRAWGAEIDVVTKESSSGGYLLSRLARVQEVLVSTRAVWTNQYASPANPSAHLREMAVQIMLQGGEDLDAVLVAISTGGTLRGIGARMRQDRPNVRVIGVDVVGSAAFGHLSARRVLNGIGSARAASRFPPARTTDCSAPAIPASSKESMFRQADGLRATETAAQRDVERGGTAGAASDFGFGADLLLGTNVVGVCLTYRGDKLHKNTVQEPLTAFRSELHVLAAA